MVITEKDVSSESEKPSGMNKAIGIWKKLWIIGAIIAVPLFFVLRCVDENEPIGIEGLEYLKYGMNRDDAISKMKDNGWTYRTTTNEAQDKETLEIMYFTALNKNEILENEKTDLLGLGFNQENILIEIVLMHKIDSVEKTKSILEKRLKDYKVLAGPIKSEKMFQYWCMNSKDNVCVVNDTGDVLEMKFIGEYYSQKLIDSFGGKEEFRKFLKAL